MVTYGLSNRGFPILWHEGYWYTRNKDYKSGAVLWYCRRRVKCRCFLIEHKGTFTVHKGPHNHEPVLATQDNLGYLGDVPVRVRRNNRIPATEIQPTIAGTEEKVQVKRSEDSDSDEDECIGIGPASDSLPCVSYAESIPENDGRPGSLSSDQPNSVLLGTKRSLNNDPLKGISASGPSPKKFAPTPATSDSVTEILFSSDEINFSPDNSDIDSKPTTSSNTSNYSVLRNPPALLRSMTKPKTVLAGVEQALNGWLKPKKFGESWDNIGLLVGSGRLSKEEKCVNTIFLCNDLTTKVLREAINASADLIIAYHPPIFSPLKAVAYGSWKEEIVAKCLGHDIAVYSPHTTLDTVIGGINDRIMNVLRLVAPPNDSTLEAITPMFLKKNSPGICFSSSADNISALFAAIPFSELENDITVSFDVDNIVNENGDQATLRVYLSDTAGKEQLDEIKEVAGSLKVKDFEHPTTAPAAALGSGRILKFKRPVNVGDIVESLRECTGVRNIKLAQGPKKEITSIALCVGSGASILKGLKVDAVITGEMTHHDVLDCLEAKQSVILCGHADSERHYLPTLAAIVKIVTQVPNVIVSNAEQSLFRYV